MQKSSATESRLPAHVGEVDLSATGLLWAGATLWYLLCEAVTALAFPGYSYADFYISDLGVAEQAVMAGRELASQIPQVMNAGFIGAGLLFFVGLALLVRALRPGVGAVAFVALGSVYTVGIVLVGLVAGSPTNVENGLIAIHATGAVLAIGGGNLAAVVSAAPLRGLGAPRLLGPPLGVVGLAASVLLSLHVGFPDGVWERAAVYSFMLWQLVIGVALILASRRTTAAPRR